MCVYTLLLSLVASSVIFSVSVDLVMVCQV